MPRLSWVVLSLFLFTPCVSAQTQLLLKNPTLSRTQIVFSYAGDLWSVSREGGDARRLTTGVGAENRPIFSPDGTLIAFTGEYDGNVDVFVVSAEGGVPKRLTWHPAPDVALGWAPDGKRVVFSSPRNSYSRFNRLFTVGLDGGLEAEIPLPMGNEASFSPDSTRLAYVPLLRAFQAWKRYRGGQTTPIWVATLESGKIEKVPRENSNDFEPMWVGDRIYFLSDRSGPVTLFYYDLRSKQVKQAAENRGLDIKSASAGPGAIVYEQFGGVYLYDLNSGKTRRVDVRVAGDMPEPRERFVKVSSRLRNAHISPTGARAVFEARGEILTVPAEKGDVRNLTNSTSVMERDPSWSPDGKTIAYFSDESGEYALHLRAQNGMGEVQKISLGEPPSFFYRPRWSPDSKKIAYTDKRLNIWYVDLEKKTPVRVDTDYYVGSPDDRSPRWSSDSKWLAYPKQLKNHLGAIFVHSTADGKSTQVTDGLSDARHPVFDKDGKHLYFTASTDSGASKEPDISSFSKPVTRNVYLIVLPKDAPSPLAPESDEEKGEEKPAADKSEDDKAKDAAKTDTKAKEDAKTPVRIDFDNIGQRILSLPMPPRRYVDLQVGKSGTIYAMEQPPSSVLVQPGPPSFTVHKYDMKTRKEEKVLDGVRFFEISHNGEKMLYRQGDRWVISAVSSPPRPGPGASGGAPSPAAQGAGPGPASDGTLKTDDIEVRIDPRAEWKQMYGEVWRIERDFFYDPGLHGLDVKTAQKRYEPYLESIASRGDLNYLFSEMLGELSVGHMFIFGGETPEVKRVPVGLLGADYKIENGRYRFARVYNGENWNPQLKAPLTQPGVNVVAGEYLLGVNGRELRATDNVYGFFEASAGKSVVLRVGPDPGGANAREVTVVPVNSETGLRNLAWIEDNRRKVDQMTGGRVAYIYMPDTSVGGYTNFNRYFFAQIGKEAAIIDERFNGGGALATDVIDYLKRQPLSMVAFREGSDWVQPQGAIFGPKAMIINEYAGSGGDAMPWYFKRSGVGPLVGKRTWGGLVGIFAVPDLMDGGGVTAPNAAVYNPKGEWEVENVGIAPDIEVELDPEAVRSGKDPQLEKAVEAVMEALKKHPLPATRRPSYPNYHKPQRAVTSGSDH